MTGALFNPFVFYIAGLFLLISLIFMISIYLSGKGLKEQLQKIGVKSSAIIQDVRQFVERERDNVNQFPTAFQTKIFHWLAFLRLRLTGPIYDSFRMALRMLKIVIGTSNYKYKVPWYLMIGDKNSGKSTVLSNTGLSHPISSPNFGLPEDHPALEWWFFEQGIVIEVSADTLQDKNTQISSNWKDILKACRHFRYDRPLDGVILAISALDLMAPTSEARFELVKKATAVADQLVKTETYFGVRLPLTILITHGDEIAGFNGFCHELPEKALNEMMGWSSLYARDQVYESSWIKTAILSTKESVFKGILRIFSRGDTRSYGEDLMVLPDALSALEPGLQDYMDTLMKVGDYRQHYILQGIYFTGKNDDVSSTPFPFLKDLFSLKIFSSQGLAIPLTNFLRTTSRQVNFLRMGVIGFIICAAFCLHLGNRYLTNTIITLIPAITTTLNDLRQETGAMGDTYDEVETLRRRGYVILKLLEQTHTHPLWTPYIPPSWYSYQRYRFQNAVARLYKSGVRDSMYSLLQARTRQLLVDTPLLAAPKSQVKAIDPIATPEFLLLQGYVKALLDLDKIQIYYNTLNDTRSLLALKTVLTYLYGYEFQPNFFQSHLYLSTNLIGTTPTPLFHLDDFKLYAEKKLYQLYNDFLRRILDPEYNYAFAQALQDTLKQLEGPRVLDANNLQKSLDDIRGLINFMTESSGSWLSNPRFDPGGRYRQMLSQIQQITFFKKNVEVKIREASKVLYDKSLKYLLSYGSPLTGYFLTVGPDKQKIQPSQGLLDLEKGLTLLMKQPFMQKIDGKALMTVIPEHQYLHWDPEGVRNALSLIEGYKSFISEHINDYPANLQNTLRVLGRAQAAINVSFVLARAQSYYQEPIYSWGSTSQQISQMHMKNVVQIAPLMISLLKDLQTIDARLLYGQLKDLLTTQMYGLLTTLDRSLQDSSFYVSSDPSFKRWNGQKNGVLTAYNLIDPSEMQSYFANQTAQLVSMILEYAGPIVEFFKSDVFDLDITQIKLVTKWDGLLKQIVMFQKSKSAPSIKALQDFMETEGNVITGASCFTALSPEVFQAKSSDYFIQKRNDIMSRMYKRCQELSAQQAVQQYIKLAQFFNQNIANTFPFILQPTATSRIGSEVPWDVMNQFFEDMSLFTPQVIAAIDQQMPNNPEWVKVKEFLMQMSEVKNFMTTYFAPKKKDGSPGLSFTLTFAANTAQSTLAQNIRDWAFLNGTKPISLLQNGNNQVIRWKSGQPVSFGFEWQMSAMPTPIDKPDNPALVKLANRSLFIYEGTWALLRAMMLHKSDTNALLKFNIPMGTTGMGPATDTAALFNKIVPQTTSGLSAPNFKIPIFPTSAPLMNPLM